MRVELHPEARAEFRAAAIWYDERQPGLGDELIADVKLTLDRIAASPRAYGQWPGADAVQPLIRRAVLSRFPYVVAYEEDPKRILVLAIAHSRRRPLYWLTRARSR